MIEINDYGYKQLWNVVATFGEKFKPECYLEIGVREGDSLKSLLKHHFPKKIVLCDTWGAQWGGSNRKGYGHIIKLLQDINYEGNVLFVTGYSQNTVPQLKGKFEFDLILVDGDHSYRGAWLDLNNSWKLLKKDGYLIFDDIRHRGSPWLLECAVRFKKEKKCKTVYLTKEGNGVVVFQK